MLDILTLLKKEYDVTEAILRVRLSLFFRIPISILHPPVTISYIHVFMSPPPFLHRLSPVLISYLARRTPKPV
jgi:hypothetical protein